MPTVNPLPATDPTFETLTLDGREVIFDVSAELIKMTNDHLGMDEWGIVVSVRGVPKSGQDFSYRTGTGRRRHQKWPPLERGLRPGTVAHSEQEARKMPVVPGARGILISLGSDLSTALIMPRNPADAMDYLQAEFGHEGKASDLFRMVQALQTNADKLEKLCRAAGCTPGVFADWCQSLDV